MSPIEVYAARFGKNYKWLASVTVMSSAVMTTGASTMVNVALPDIMGAFGLGQDQVQWLSTGFLASMTATMLLTAWILRNFGYRFCFLGAMTVFSIGSLIGAISVSNAEIIFARVLQGMAAGLIQSSSMVVLSQVFPREQRGRAMGIYTIGVILAPALGPAFAGFLVDEYSWRYVFISLMPFCLISMGMAMVFLPGRDPSGEKLPLDGWGLLSLCAFLCCLLTALSNGQRWGWDSDMLLLLFFLAAVFAAAFIIREATCRFPLLNIRLFVNKNFAVCCLVAFALGAGIYGSTYIVPLFVQLVQGYTPTRSGFLLMPAGFALAVISPVAGLLGDRLPPWIPVTAGLLLFGLSNYLCGGGDVDTAFWTFAIWIVWGRVGLGLINPSLNAGALRTLPHEQLAQGAGSLNFIRQLGGVLGVNLLSTFIDRSTMFHSDALAQNLDYSNPAAGEAVRQLNLILTADGNPFGARLSSGTPPAAMEYLEMVIVPKARLFAYQDGFMVVGIVFFLIIPLALLIRGHKTAD